MKYAAAGHMIFPPDHQHFIFLAERRYVHHKALRQNFLEAAGLFWTNPNRKRHDPNIGEDPKTATGYGVQPEPVRQLAEPVRVRNL